MACKYTYQGKVYSEQEFRNFLSEKELSNLAKSDNLPEKVVSKFQKDVPSSINKETKATGGDGLSFTTHNKEIITGKKLTDALNKVADDMVESAKRKRQEYYASHVTEKQKDDILKKDIQYAESVRKGKNINNFTIWQRINTELTGETPPLLPNNPPKSETPLTVENKPQSILGSEVVSSIEPIVSEEPSLNNNYTATLEFKNLPSITEPKTEAELQKIKDAVKKNGGNVVGNDMWVGADTDFDGLAKDIGNYAIYIKDVNGQRAVLPYEYAKELLKNKEFANRIRSANIRLTNKFWAHDGFMSDLILKNENKKLADKVTGEIPTEIQSSISGAHNILPQRRADFIDALNDKKVQDAIKNSGATIKILEPHNFDLSTAGFIKKSEKGNTIYLNPDSQDYRITILHEAGELWWKHATKEQRDNLLEIAKKDKGKKEYPNDLREKAIDGLFNNDYADKVNPPTEVPKDIADKAAGGGENKIIEYRNKKSPLDGQHFEIVDVSKSGTVTLKPVEGGRVNKGKANVTLSKQIFEKASKEGYYSEIKAGGGENVGAALPTEQITNNENVDVGAALPEQPKSKFQIAKENASNSLKAAKEYRNQRNQNLGIVKDSPDEIKKQAELDRKALDDLIDVAREAVNEGIKSVADFAKELGEQVSDLVQKAWDVANNTLKYEDAVKGLENPPPPDLTEGTEKLPTDDKGRDLAVMKRLMDSKVISDETKQKLTLRGLKYDPVNFDEAHTEAKEIVKSFGIDAALDLVRQNKLGEAVSTFVYGESIDRASQMSMDKRYSPENREKWANKEADIAYEFAVNSKGYGQRIAAIGDWYKRSPLGLEKSYEKLTKELNDESLSSLDPQIRSAYEDIFSHPDVQKLLSENEQLKAALANRKPIINKERLKKIDDYFDGIKSDLDKNVYSSVVPIPVLKGAIEAMRAAAKAGSIAADVIKAGIDFITNHHDGEFDVQAFKDKYEEPIKNLVTESHNSDWDKVVKALEPQDRSAARRNKSKYADTLVKIRSLSDAGRSNLLKSVMNDLNKQNLITNADLEAYGKGEKSLPDLMNEMGDANREKTVKLINDTADAIKKAGDKKVITKSDEAILKAWEKKLTNFDPDQRSIFFKNVMAELVKRGALDYDSFKHMFAEALGLPQLDEATKIKLREIAKLQNDAIDLGKELKNDPSNPELLKRYQDAKAKSENAAVEQQKMFARPQGLFDKFLWGVRMNTLSVMTQGKALLGNLATLIPRTISGTAASLSDMVLSHIPFANAWFGDNPLTKTNYFLSAKSIPEHFTEAAAQSGKELVTGVYKKTTGTNEFTKSSPVHPKETAIKLYDYWSKRAQGKSRSPLSTKQLISMHYDVTAGAFAEMMGRLINFTHNTYGERQAKSVTEMLGKQMGLSGTELQSFIEQPSEDAMTRIREEAKRSTFQQDNILTHLIKGLNKKLPEEASGTQRRIAAGAKVLTTLTLPFPRFAMNAFVYGLEIMSPEYRFARAIEKAATKDRMKFNYYIGQATTGLALRYVILPALVRNRLFSFAANYSGDNKHLKFSPDLMPPSHFNLQGFYRYLHGDDPTYQNGDFTVDAKWLGMLGEDGVAMSDKYSTMTKEEANKLSYNAAEPYHYAQQLYHDAGFEFNHLMTQGVMQGAFNGMQSFTDGQRGINNFVESMTGMAMNAFYPQTIYQGVNIIRDSPQPQITDYDSKGSLGIIKNTSETAVNTVLDRFGLKSLPPKIDESGKPIERKSGYSTAAGSQTVYEWQFKVANLWENSDNGKGNKNDEYLPSLIPRTVKIEGIDYPLTPQQYSQFSQAVGNYRSTYISAYQHQTHFLDGATYQDKNGNQTRTVDALKVFYKQGLEDAKNQFIQSHMNEFQNLAQQKIVEQKKIK